MFAKDLMWGADGDRKNRDPQIIADLKIQLSEALF
jgi:hypothetical protein